jgi:membrane protein
LPIQFVKQVVMEYMDDECPMMAAALSFYAVFSLPPLLFLLFLGTGALIGANQAEEGLISEASRLFGPSAAAQFSVMLKRAGQNGAGEGAAVIASATALLFGATAAFVQLQAALNRVWGVGPNPDRPIVIAYLGRRLGSVGMMAVLGLFLLASLGLSTLLAAAGETFLAGVSENVLQVVDLTFNATVFTVLFAAMFRWIPDAKILWRDVWVGAAATMILFLAAKHGAALYLGGGQTGGTRSAAASLTIFMSWVYFEAAALLLGAEFTQVWVQRRGRRIEPEDDAIRVTLLRGNPSPSK